MLTGDGFGPSPDRGDFHEIAVEGGSTWDVTVVLENGGATLVRLQRPGTVFLRLQ